MRIERNIKKVVNAILEGKDIRKQLSTYVTEAEMSLEELKNLIPKYASAREESAGLAEFFDANPEIFDMLLGELDDEYLDLLTITHPKTYALLKSCGLDFIGKQYNSNGGMDVWDQDYNGGIVFGHDSCESPSLYAQFYWTDTEEDGNILIARCVSKDNSSGYTAFDDDDDMLWYLNTKFSSSGEVKAFIKKVAEKVRKTK